MKKQTTNSRETIIHSNLILISDTNGKILYYENFDDHINMLRYENAVGRSIFELYPYFSRDELTMFKAIDSKKAIVNELQEFEINGIQKKSLNSAYPLINETGVIGCLVISTELDNKPRRRKSNIISAKYDFNDILTQNPIFLSSFARLRRLAEGDANILIYGETGTGKELIAHTIHNNSSRRNEPLIIQNCAAIPDNLMESIFFGSVKGSFTGATDKGGLFEAAEGGTLFLDEVNSLPSDMQGKLLRAIENKAVRRVGESFERETDVRIITSTNEQLEKMVSNGTFRKDLFYRLNVASFSIPPLRERNDDIPLLCNHYINHFNMLLNRKITGVANDVMIFFERYRWDGNVRELKNVIEYACTMKTGGEITLNDIPEYMLIESMHLDHESTNVQIETNGKPDLEKYFISGATLASQINALEKDIIESSLQRNRYNITKVSKELNVSRQTLYKKLEKYKLF